MAAGAPGELDGQGLVARGARRSTSREGAACGARDQRGRGARAAGGTHNQDGRPGGAPAAMPWHFKWRATTVEGHFFTDGQRVHGAICRSALLVFFFRVLGCSSDLAGSLVMGDEMWNRSWQPSTAVQLAS